MNKVHTIHVRHSNKPFDYFLHDTPFVGLVHSMPAVLNLVGGTAFLTCVGTPFVGLVHSMPAVLNLVGGTAFLTCVGKKMCVINLIYFIFIAQNLLLPNP